MIARLKRWLRDMRRGYTVTDIARARLRLRQIKYTGAFVPLSGAELAAIVGEGLR